VDVVANIDWGGEKASRTNARGQTEFDRLV
jgi:hypothetical protein